MYSANTIVRLAKKNLDKIYGEKSAEASKRIAKAVNEFIKLYGEGDFSVFSVSGRSEICGNHTDHNLGEVAAASIDVDIIAVAREVKGSIIRVKSEGFDEDVVDIKLLKPQSEEAGKSAALIRGVVDGLKKNGRKYGAFVAYTTNQIKKGSGLSSSAAFEDMIGTIENYIYNEGKIGFTEIAQLGQYSENKFFGKPCGLMDQIACAAGGFVHIDFKDPANPKTEKVKFDPEKHGYALYIVDTGGSHVNLTPDYASVPAEMKSVAELFGQKTLRGITEKKLISKTNEIREKLGDRAMLRAIHFVRENDRVRDLFKALRNDDIEEFLNVVRLSGNSSATLLQNCYSVTDVKEQGILLACAIAESVVGEKGAFRVHGGGFAGTIQAYVPLDKENLFVRKMSESFGKDSVTKLRIRPYGAVKVL